MANLSNKIARVDVLIGGTDQAKKQLDVMRKQWGDLGKKVDEAKKLMEKSTNTVDYDKYNKARTDALKEQKQVNRAIIETERNINTVQKYLTDISGQTIRSLNQGKKALSQMLLGIKPENLKSLETVRGFISQIGDEAQRRRGNLVEFSDIIGNIGNVSDKSLSMAKQRLIDLAGSTNQNTQKMAQYREELAKVEAEERRRSEAKAGVVLGNLNGSSLNEIQEAIKITEKLRNSQQLGSQAWKNYNEEIIRGNKFLEDYNRSEASIAMTNRMRDLGTASTASLEEMQKFWKAQVDGAKQGSAELNVYTENLRKVEAEAQQRANARAQTTLGNVQSGTFSGTIAETKEAIKQLEQFKQQLKTTNTTGIKEVDDAVALLNAQLKQATNAAMSLDTALQQADDLKNGTFNGTVEDVERLKKVLKEYKDQLKVSDVDGLKKIDEAFRNIHGSEVKANREAIDIQNTLKNLKSASLNDLKAAAAQLQEELNSASQTSAEFIQKSADLRKVNGQIKDVTDQWKEQDSAVMKVIKRLTAYILVYAGFNELWGKIKQFTQANLELSDSLADIQKTTGLSAKSVAELSREIDSIDTRSSQQELHALAYEAGKLGISAEKDVLQFVKAGNELIAALGEDLGGSEAVRGLMKINDLLGETKRLGIEKALLATGSAINVLSQTSTASAGPIADVVSRLGSIGSQAKLSMADLIALGGTADELSQEVEVSGTALSKFITSLQTNTRGIAQAVGINDEELQKLMDAGQTMEAMIMVLERTKNMGGLKEISPLMKEFGSDGERLNRVITAFASNVDVLKLRVDSSRTAFTEATSVTEEYNIKNESAMALTQRLGNTMMEAFVNSGFVAVLKDILLIIMDIPQWVDRNRTAFLALKIVLAEILLLIAAKNWTSFVGVLKSMGAFIAGPFIAAWKALRLQILAAEVSLVMTGKSVTGVAGAFRILWTVIKANPIGIFLTLVTAVGVAMYDLSTRVSENVKATAAYNAELLKERLRLDSLFNGLKSTNLSLDERRKLIDQINSQYSSYLGFMLSEKDSADKLAAAHDLVNAKIRERIALSFKQKSAERAEEKFGSRIQDSLVGMHNEFENAPGITGARSQEAADAVQNVVLNNITEPMDKILTLVKSELERKFNNETGSYGSSVYFDMQSNLKSFITARKDYQKELKVTDDFYNSEIKKAHEDMTNAGAKALNILTDEYNALQKLSEKGLDEQQLAENNKARLAKAQEYISLANKQMETATEQQRKHLQEAIGNYTKVVEELTPKSTKHLNVWGEGLSLETASVDQLVAKYKVLFDERKTMREDAKYDTVYSKQFADRKESMQWYLSELKTIEAQLKKMGYNEKGNFLKEKKESTRKISYGGATKTVKEINDESTAALSALEAYFNKEQEAITRSYVEKQITEEEMNRQTLKKDEEFLTDRIALRRKLLGKAGGEHFDQSKYKQTDADTGETTEYFKGKNLAQLQGFINKMGQRMTDGMLNKLTEDELKIMMKAAEHMAKIQKIILDNDFTGQVDKQYQDELEALELFWGKEEAVTVEAGDTRLAYLRMLSAESYELDASGLSKRMGKYGEFGQWMQGRSAEDYEALLTMLRKYHDDTEEAENREIARRQRIADKKWSKSGAKTGWDATDKEGEQEVTLVKNLNDLGLTSDSQVDDAEVKLYESRLMAAQAYYDFVLSEGGDVTEAEKRRSEAALELAAKEMDITKSKLEKLKQYTDAVVDFSGQMGEAAFSEVADRQAAGKQLLRTVMQLTKDLIMEKIKELIMKKALGAQELILTQGVETTKLGIQGGAAVADLTVQGAKTAGDVALGAASGGAKTIGQLGWWGIPLVAVIGAALSALMGMAMGKMNKAKEEIANTTGVSSKGRVAAGMLTYADGDYPVLGNDGKIYNASYQKELKTGVYGGGAHFGIFSEKQPEMIVDGKTTENLMLNHRDIYESIITLARTGRLNKSMPTYAVGNYPSIPSSMGSGGGDSPLGAGSDPEMMSVLSGMSDVIGELNERLKSPFNAVIDPYGSKGAVNGLNKAESFMKKRNLIK